MRSETPDTRRTRKVLLADNHTMFRRGLTRMLTSHGGMEVVGGGAQRRGGAAPLPRGEAGRDGDGSADALREGHGVAAADALRFTSARGDHGHHVGGSALPARADGARGERLPAKERIGRAPHRPPSAPPSPIPRTSNRTSSSLVLSTLSSVRSRISRGMTDPFPPLVVCPTVRWPRASTWRRRPSGVTSPTPTRRWAATRGAKLRARPSRSDGPRRKTSPRRTGEALAPAPGRSTGTACSSARCRAQRGILPACR